MSVKFLRNSLISACLIVLIPAAAVAQSSTPANTPLEDEVIARGTIRGADPAMGAFFSGDYATAEIEFQKNFRRLKRADMNMRDNVNAIGGAQTTNQIQNGLSQTSGAGGGAAGSVAADSSVNYSSLTLRTREQGEGVTSGTDIGFQLYMTAMSQLKLRKFDDAEDNFQKAIALNRSLYDARMRLGLLALRGGDVEAARKQLSRLEGQIRKCNNVCDAVVEMAEARDVLADALRKSGA